MDPLLFLLTEAPHLNGSGSPIAWGAGITATIALITAGSLAFERVFSRFGAWREHKLDVTTQVHDHHIAVASAATGMASAVRELLEPLQGEVRALREETHCLRREVEALRAVLEEHGIPHPLGGPLDRHFAGPRLDPDDDEEGLPKHLGRT